jgi:hypothetical protein
LRSRCLVVSLLAVAFVLIGGPAFADPPDQTRVTGTDVLELPAGAACPFAVRIEVDQNFKVISFAEPVGQGIATLTAGNISAVVTNLANGTSVWLDISGPAFLDESDAPVFSTGQTLLFTDGGLLHAAGRITRDAAGELHVNGRTRDVCAMLAEA